MDKTVLTKFIDKYSLGGMNESVVWEIKDNAVCTSFSSDDKTLVGNVITLGSKPNEKVDLEDCKFGIQKTTELSKMLNIMGDDIKLSLLSSNDRLISFCISDDSFNGKFRISEPSVIPKAGKVNNQPDFEMTIKLDTEFVSNFINAKNALSEANVFAVESYDDKINIIMNYSNNNVNKITYSAKGSSVVNFQPILFSAEKVKNILVANKACETGELKISQTGLALFDFNEKNHTSKYYLVKMNLIN